MRLRLMLTTCVLWEAAAVAAYTTLCYGLMISGALAADAVLRTDYLSQMDPFVVGALSGFLGGMIRAIRSDVSTLRAVWTDAVPGAIAGATAWPFTLSIFGPLLFTLQSTMDVVLTLGAKVAVAATLTAIGLTVFMGAIEGVFKTFTKKGAGNASDPRA